MAHILFIDPIEKLVVKKDSTMLMALTLKKRGEEVYFLFENDFFIQNTGQLTYQCYEFDGDIEDNFYVSNFSLTQSKSVLMDENITFHMRIDPPYDSRYQRYLWMQQFLEKYGVKVVNNPVGIMKNSEKLEAYKRENSLPSFVGSSLSGATQFVKQLEAEGVSELILKPLDLYQGIGVEKVTIDNQFETIFKKKSDEFQGPVVVQPFDESVTEGEIRSIYYKAQELGTILKTPKAGEFLANIAQGAKYERYEMAQELKDECFEICSDLLKDGVDLVAFDILGGKISEVNVTCPGLLVEVSSAMKENLAEKMFL
ncbi:RimK family alpha-L-glutamate ligase [Bacteriovorax sp. DB6_IX]|uniref:ATP-grasp domain-containing protein n=1 Tax=Bacteriovorax sp. DB6_IX TaxID=1353530 RepID=UPI00038A47B6|nr:glutathione synthetase/glutathione synthetase [Bacteriovorax sp. DB6_IX]EQC50561.1 prokaryotic glutathione synthetase, N-terminal domain / glutathione synthetase, ATP-binding domain multi-domain protein [Bacteriovorax sp. DB6_IX]